MARQEFHPFEGVIQKGPSTAERAPKTRKTRTQHGEEQKAAVRETRNQNIAAMLAARATGTASLRSARPTVAFAVAAARAAPRALSSKPPEKPVPSPEEEAAKQAAQMRALDVVLEAQNTTGELGLCGLVSRGFSVS